MCAQCALAAKGTGIRGNGEQGAHAQFGWVCKTIAFDERIGVDIKAARQAIGPFALM